VTAALGVGVVINVVMVACLSDPAGASGAPPRAIGLRAPLHPEVGDDEGLILSVTRLRGLASGYTPSDTLPDTSKSYRIHARYILGYIKIHHDTYPITIADNKPTRAHVPRSLLRAAEQVAT
jgi:hypothetical protein